MMKKNKKKRKRRSICVFAFITSLDIYFLFSFSPLTHFSYSSSPSGLNNKGTLYSQHNHNEQTAQLSIHTSSRIRTDLRRCGAVTSRVARPNGNTTLQIVTVRVGTQIQYHCEFHHPLWYIMHSYDHQNFIFSVLTCSMRCFKRSNSSRCFSLFIKS